MTSLPTTLNSLIAEINAGTILRDVAKFWGYRSTVYGTQLSQASHFLLNRYLENGIQAEVRSYPADNGKTLTPAYRIDQFKLPYAWDPHSATLEIVTPTEHAGLICSFAEEPLCLVGNSTSTPPEGITAEVVVIHTGEKDADFQGIDCQGKIVLVDAWSCSADGFARKHGAVGMVSDSVTPPWTRNLPPARAGLDTPDLTMWSTIDAYGGEYPFWCFNLTPRQGAKLREIIDTSKTPVRLHAKINANLSAGVSDLVNAVIPGTSLVDEEIWVFTHSSEPGALDNASGCCTALEISRAIRSLVESGQLPQPKRTIRFLSALETFGYLPYIAERHEDWGKIKAGIAVDSIGKDHRKGGGILQVNASPDYNPSFTDDILYHIFDRIAKEGNPRFGNEPFEHFIWKASPFFPNNDNMTADGYFNIATPMLCCWPDQYYHSNLDTPDKLSAGQMKRAAVGSAAYVYTLACADKEDLQWLSDLCITAWKMRILQSVDPNTDSRNGQLVLLRAQDALLSLSKFIPTEEPIVDNWSKRLETFYLEQIADIYPSAQKPVPTVEPSFEGCDFSGLTGKIKPLRWHFPKPDTFSSKGLTEYNRIKSQYENIETVWQLINGDRTARQICQRTLLPCEAVVQLIRLLKDEKVVELS